MLWLTVEATTTNVGRAGCCACRPACRPLMLTGRGHLRRAADAWSHSTGLPGSALSTRGQWLRWSLPLCSPPSCVWCSGVGLNPGLFPARGPNSEFQTSFAPATEESWKILEEAHGCCTHHGASFPCEELERAPELHDAPSRWPSECEGGVRAEGGGDAGPGCFGTGEPSEEEERRRQGRRETERKVGKMKGACAEKGRELICMFSDGQSRHLDRTRKEA